MRRRITQKALYVGAILLFLLLSLSLYQQRGMTFVYGQESEVQTEEENTDAEQSSADSEDQEGQEEETETVEDQQVEELKDKVASKVAELTETEYGTAGFVQTVEDTTILLNTRTSEVEVFVDEDITSIYTVENGSLKDRELEDIEITDYLTITGPKLEGTLNANMIIIDTSYTVRSGKIIEANEDDFYLSVITLDKTTYTLDIEKETQQEMYNMQTSEIEGIGFSKLKEGDTIHFTAQAGWRDDQERFSVTSLLIIPQEYFIK